ncbi:MAG: hypothetical protein IJI87_02385 [Mogibacterium sp.]|nr:hypothetical protein [Mogibacterium sp.]MBQ9076115.1 hypothetical protein [Mogibacterium sp.]
MDRDNEKVLYNVLFPIWLLVFFPSYLWLILIPANYMIDRIVLRWSLGDMPDNGMFCRKNTWKICLAGFLGDFVGAIALFFISELLLGFGDDGATFIEKAGDGIMFDPFTNVLSFLIIAAGIALSAVCIYKLDKRILGKTELEPEQAKRAALRLTLFTAPYLYLIPSRWFY